MGCPVSLTKASFLFHFHDGLMSLPVLWMAHAHLHKPYKRGHYEDNNMEAKGTLHLNQFERLQFGLIGEIHFHRVYLPGIYYELSEVIEIWLLTYISSTLPHCYFPITMCNFCHFIPFLIETKLRKSSNPDKAKTLTEDLLRRKNLIYHLSMFSLRGEFSLMA